MEPVVNNFFSILRSAKCISLYILAHDQNGFPIRFTKKLTKVKSRQLSLTNTNKPNDKLTTMFLRRSLITRYSNTYNTKAVARAQTALKQRSFRISTVLKMDQNYGSFSVRQLKNLLVSRGVDFRDCVEKADLVKRAEETKDLDAGTFPPRTTTSTVAGLKCAEITNCASPDVIAVVLHGFGANKEDLASIGKQILSQSYFKTKSLMVFPDAPMDMGSGSRAWWHIDIPAIFMKIMQGQTEEMFAEIPEGAPQASKQVTTLIKDLCKRTGLPLSKVVLAGFSQGAMLSTDVSLRLDENLGGVCLFSGMPICKNEWKDLVGKHKDLRVLQTHGSADPVLPFEFGKNLQELLQNGGISSHEFVKFDGPHTIPQEGVAKFQQMVKNVASE